MHGMVSGGGEMVHEVVFLTVVDVVKKSGRGTIEAGDMRRRGQFDVACDFA